MKKVKVKTSGYSLGLIIVAFLLAVSIFFSFSGAWFTDKAEDGGAVLMKFGTVKIQEFAVGTTVNNMTQVDSEKLQYGDEDFDDSNTDYDYPGVNSAISNAEQDGGYYLIEAGTRIITRIYFVNASNVPVYYLLVHTDAEEHETYYIIDSANSRLVEIEDGSDYAEAVAPENPSSPSFPSPVLAPGDEPLPISLTFILKTTVDAGSGYESDDPNLDSKTATQDIWTVSGLDGAAFAKTNLTHQVVYDATINLGTYLFNKTFDLRIIQVSNISESAYQGATSIGEAAFGLLTN